jgi:endo-1,4-beta-mannosidase
MRRLVTSLLAVVLVAVSILTSALKAAVPPELGPWPVVKVEGWAREHSWLVGCNFSPSTAINQLEMWQADTFDLPTIDRELGWAEWLGFNSIRVFLHHLPWERNPQAFLQRIEQFLATADRHKIGVMFVLLDGCWDPYPHSGKQHPPRTGLHNSGWVQSPGLVILKNPERHEELKAYITGVVGHFRTDQRVHAWDLFNEPDNANRSSYGRFELANKADLALVLLKKELAWARSVDPQQPLTVGVGL